MRVAVKFTVWSTVTGEVGTTLNATVGAVGVMVRFTIAEEAELKFEFVEVNTASIVADPESLCTAEWLGWWKYPYRLLCPAV